MTSILNFLVWKYQICPIFLLKLCGTTMTSYMPIFSYKYFNKKPKESQTRWRSQWKFPVLENLPLPNQSPVEVLVGEWLQKQGRCGKEKRLVKKTEGDCQLTWAGRMQRWSDNSLCGPCASGILARTNYAF